jgi:hypothetical protein
MLISFTIFFLFYFLPFGGELKRMIFRPFLEHRLKRFTKLLKQNLAEMSFLAKKPKK